MLGHAGAAMTLDTYADLFEDDLDDVAIALNRHREANLRGWPLRTRAEPRSGER